MCIRDRSLQLHPDPGRHRRGRVFRVRGVLVRQGLVGLVSAQAAIAQARAELAKAQEILRATQAQYRAGVTTLPLLLNAQVGLTTAQTDYVNALYALRQAEQTFLYALGESDSNQPV